MAKNWLEFNEKNFNEVVREGLERIVASDGLDIACPSCGVPMKLKAEPNACESCGATVVLDVSGLL